MGPTHQYLFVLVFAIVFVFLVYCICICILACSHHAGAPPSRGGTFSKSLVFQAISNVVVIGHDIFALLLCQFFNLGPHPAKLLFGFFSFFGPNKPTGRKCCSGIMSNFLNFLNLFWHYYLIGNIQDHFVAIQTSSRHPQTRSRHPGIHRLFWSKWATGSK